MKGEALGTLVKNRHHLGRGPLLRAEDMSRPHWTTKGVVHIAGYRDIEVVQQSDIIPALLGSQHIDDGPQHPYPHIARGTASQTDDKPACTFLDGIGYKDASAITGSPQRIALFFFQEGKTTRLGNLHHCGIVEHQVTSLDSPHHRVESIHFHQVATHCLPERLNPPFSSIAHGHGQRVGTTATGHNTIGGSPIGL